MPNGALYVKLDPESFERLIRLSHDQRRQPGDQAALLLRQVLEQHEKNQSKQAAAAA